MDLYPLYTFVVIGIILLIWWLRDKQRKKTHLEISLDKYGAIVDFLDRLRADHRDGRYGESSSHIPDEFVLLYCERKGYCNYVFNDGKFIRVLTEKGNEILSFMNYEDYISAKARDNGKTWWPIRIAFFALIVSGYAAYLKATEPKETEQTKTRLIQLETSIKTLTDSLNALNHRASIEHTPTISNPVNTAKPVEKGQSVKKGVKK